MATTTTRKRTTTSKAKTTKKTTVEEPVVQPVEEAQVEEPVTEVAKPKVAEPKVAAKPVKERRKFNDSDGIVCRSIVQGGLFLEGAKTHMLYEWVGYGDKTQVEYADLASAVRVKSPFLFSPLFIVEDDDFIEEFTTLKKFYTENYTVHDLEKILQYPVDRMVEEISTLPKAAIESLKVIAASQISDGVLDSVKKISALDELFGTNLNVLAEFEH